LFTFFTSLIAYAREQDVLHAIDSYKIGFYASIASILTGKPLYTTLAGRGILDLPGGKRRYYFAHDMYRWVTLHRSSGTIASCKEFIGIAKRIAPKNTLVYLPNPVDSHVFRPEQPPADLVEKYKGKRVILSVRRLVPKNGIQYLVQAMPYVKERFPDIQYIAIGTGHLEEYIHESAKKLGVTDVIDFLGSVRNEHVRPYIALAETVVFPSSAEATSLACTEAMAMGKPIVASAVGGFPEMLTDGKEGFLVRLFDREESVYAAPLEIGEDRVRLLADAICRILESAELRQRMGLAARQRVDRELSWDVVGRKILELYQSTRPRSHQGRS
jgi:phosphatidyl-myo-inositol dimannoside synthase